MQAGQEAPTTAAAPLKYLIADKSVVVEGLVAAPKGSLVVDLERLLTALAQHGLDIVSSPIPVRGSTSGSASRCEVQGPDSPLPPRLLLEPAEGSQRPEQLPAGPARPALQLIAQVGQESCSSDVVLIEDSGPEMSSPRPKVAVKREASCGRAQQARRAVAKPRGNSLRTRPLQASTAGPATASADIHAATASGDAQAATAEPATPSCGPRTKKPKRALLKEEPVLAADVGIPPALQLPEQAPLLPPDNASGGTASAPAHSREATGAAKSKARNRPGKAAVSNQAEGSGTAGPAQAAPAPKDRKGQAKASKAEGSGPPGSAEAAPAPKDRKGKAKASGAECSGAAGPAEAAPAPTGKKRKAKASEAEGSGSAAVKEEAEGSGAVGPGEAAPAPKGKKRKAKASEAEGSGPAVPAELSGAARPGGAAPAAKGKKRKVKAEELGEGQEVKVSNPRKARTGSDLVETPMAAADFQAAAAALAEVELGKEYIYAPGYTVSSTLARKMSSSSLLHGQEPYRKLGLKVYEQPQISPEDCKLVLATQDLYWKIYQEAKITEQARYDAAGGKHPDGKAMSKRPDVKARTRMVLEGKTCNALKRAGHVPGHQLNQRYFSRSEIAMLGLHFLPVAGIQTATKQDLPKGCPPIALAVVSSGCYEDDADAGESMEMTGEGGNNLLGDKKQVADQQLKAGNLALVGNIQLGIPVRMIRKNKAKGSEIGSLYIFDGMYDVVKYKKVPGNSGFFVYKYRLQRRPNQGELYSKALVFGGGAAPKDFTAESRKKEVRYLFSEDISNGKETIPVVGVNDWDTDVVTIGTSDDSAQNLPLVHDVLGCPALQRYITRDEVAPGIPEPAVLEVPEQYKKDPHKFIAQLNSGALPYQLAGDNTTGILARMPMAMVYECGPWTGCKDGIACPQALTQRGCPWRLELFKTKGRGWGVRSWDTIPFGAFITTFRGLIRPHAAHEEDDTFVFNLDKRSDMTWDNKFLDEPDTQRECKYSLDSTRIGNVGRYINHSCNPNCFVQPVLSEHGDKEMPSICFFAMRNIPPMEELGYDYGADYIQTRLGGCCRCGDVICPFAGVPTPAPSP